MSPRSKFALAARCRQATRRALTNRPAASSKGWAALRGITERFQVLLSSEQVRARRRHSQRTGKSMGALMRNAADRACVGAEAKERARDLESLASMELPVEDWPAMVRQIEPS